MKLVNIDTKKGLTQRLAIILKHTQSYFNGWDKDRLLRLWYHTLHTIGAKEMIKRIDDKLYNRV